jgi:heme/copper-type cytochrome/quinol oxidase subunit 3
VSADTPRVEVGAGFGPPAVDAGTAGALAESGHAHPPNLAHHFDSYEQQQASASLGVWLFLVTEIMFFGGLFTAYILYRSK